MVVGTGDEGALPAAPLPLCRSEQEDEGLQRKLSKVSVTLAQRQASRKWREMSELGALEQGLGRDRHGYFLRVE